MYVMLMRCPRCKGTGQSRVPSMLLEPTSTEVVVHGFGEPATLRVRKAYPVKCKLCDGSGQMPVELPALVDVGPMPAPTEKCSCEDKDGDKDV